LDGPATPGSAAAGTTAVSLSSASDMTSNYFCDKNKQKYSQLNDYNETIISERRALTVTTLSLQGWEMGIKTRRGISVVGL